MPSSQRELLVLKRAVTIGSLCLGFLGAGTAVWVGDSLSAAVPANIGPAPADLPARDVHIPVEPDREVAGWFAEAPGARATIVLMHSLRANRAAMAQRATFLHRQGYHVLLFDFQAHGESAGDAITFGDLESADAAAAVRFARELNPGLPVGVVGVSLGGAAILLAQPEAKVDAVVVEMVYPTATDAIRNRLRLRIGPLAPVLTPLLLLQLRLQLGVPPGRLRPIEHIGDLHSPVLVMAGSEDQRTPPAESKALFDAAAEPKEFVLIDGARHEDFYGHSPELYESVVARFFGRYLESGGHPTHR